MLEKASTKQVNNNAIKKQNKTHGELPPLRRDGKTPKKMEDSSLLTAHNDGKCPSSSVMMWGFMSSDVGLTY